MNITMLSRVALAVAASGSLLFASAGCGSTGDDTDGSGGSGGKKTTLTVFAAASLTGSFTELGHRFESAHKGVKVRFSFAGSDALAQQINAGAPADVFASASPKTMKMVTDAENADGTPQVFVRNKLEIAVPKKNPGHVRGLKDLTDPKLKVVLCAKDVPCGAAAHKALDAAGMTIHPASEEKDVKAALTKVSLDEADAALVYRTDVKAAKGKVQGIGFPEADKAINDYPMVTVAKAPHKDLAAQFEKLVRSKQGQKVMTGAGFESP